MMELKKELLGKKLVMTPEMFVAELTNVLVAVIGITQETKMSAAEIKVYSKQWATQYMNNVYDKNINSKPDDPEEIQ
jgi:hypothetical protein